MCFGTWKRGAGGGGGWRGSWTGRGSLGAVEEEVAGGAVGIAALPNRALGDGGGGGGGGGGRLDALCLIKRWRTVVEECGGGSRCRTQ